MITYPSVSYQEIKFYSTFSKMPKSAPQLMSAMGEGDCTLISSNSWTKYGGEIKFWMWV